MFRTIRGNLCRMISVTFRFPDDADAMLSGIGTKLDAPPPPEADYAKTRIRLYSVLFLSAMMTKAGVPEDFIQRFTKLNVENFPEDEPVH